MADKVREKARALVAAKMRSMAQTGKEEKTAVPMEGKTKGPRYPWGLSLNLDHATMERLGLGDLAGGQEVEIHAKGKMTSVSHNEDEDGKPRRSGSVQITHMRLKPRASARVVKKDNERAESKKDDEAAEGED